MLHDKSTVYSQRIVCVNNESHIYCIMFTFVVLCLLGNDDILWNYSSSLLSLLSESAAIVINIKQLNSKIASVSLKLIKFSILYNSYD